MAGRQARSLTGLLIGRTVKPRDEPAHRWTVALWKLIQMPSKDFVTGMFNGQPDLPKKPNGVYNEQERKAYILLHGISSNFSSLCPVRKLIVSHVG